MAVKNTFLLLFLSCFSFLSIVNAQRALRDSAILKAKIARTDSLLQVAAYEEALQQAQNNYDTYKVIKRQQLRLLQIELCVQLGIAKFRNAYYSEASNLLQTAKDDLLEDKQGSNALLSKTSAFLAMTYYDQHKLHQANSFVDSMLSILPTTEDDTNLATLYEVKALYYSDYYATTKAKHWYKQARTIREKAIPADSAQYILALLYEGNYKYASADFEEALPLFQQAEDWADQVNANAHYRGAINYLLARLYSSNKQTQRAAIYLTKALTAYKQVHHEWHPVVLSCYESLAENHRRAGDTEQAIETHQKIITIITSNYDDEPVELGLTYHNLGLNYSDTGAHELADEYYRKGIEILKRFDEADPSIRNLLYTSLNNVVNLLWYKGELDLALQGYQQLIEEIIIARGEDSPLLPQVYNNSGLTYQDLNQHQSALKQYNDGLRILGFNEKNDEPFAGMISPFEVQYLLWNRAENYLDWYRSEGKKEHLLAAQKDYAFSVLFLDEVRKGFREESTKIGFAGENKVVYERGIEVELLLFEQDQDQIHLKIAFQYAEKARSLVLLDLFRRNQVENFADLPKEIRQEEQVLAKQLRTTEAAYYQELIRPLSDSLRVVEKTTNLDHAKEKYNRFLDRIQRNHSNYFNLKFSTKVIRVEEIQKQLLDDSTALVEYYLGSDNNYVFVITTDTLVLKRLEANFDAAAASLLLLENISQYDIQSTSPYSLELATQYDSLAYGLYQNLFKGIEKELPTKLLLIPDAQLGVLPFGILLTQPSRRAGAFAAHSYLVQSHQLTYSYSATLVAALSERPLPRASNWLGVAPVYENSPIYTPTVNGIRDTLYYSRLPGNQLEVQAALSYTGGEALTGQLATKKSFLSRIPSYSFIHFSGHATVDKNANSPGFLVFHNNSDQANQVLLYAGEIYNLSFRDKYLILSACETTVGNYYPGEGIISLARAFAYAGAKGLISSLWQVSDQSTTVLMGKMYEKLATEQGRPNNGLHQAKLSIIDAGGRFAHPFFWGGFIAIGSFR